MARVIAFASSLALSGCSQFGAQSLFTDLQTLPPDVLERSALCQMAEGNASADGVYTNGQAQIISVVEFNDGCEGVKSLGNRNGAVEFE